VAIYLNITTKITYFNFAIFHTPHVYSFLSDYCAKVHQLIGIEKYFASLSNAVRSMSRALTIPFCIKLIITRSGCPEFISRHGDETIMVSRKYLYLIDVGIGIINNFIFTINIHLRQATMCR